jgi:hypothetical protein
MAKRLLLARAGDQRLTDWRERDTSPGATPNATAAAKNHIAPRSLNTFIKFPFDF